MNGFIKVSDELVVEGLVAVNTGYGNVVCEFEELFYIFAEEFTSVGRYVTVYGIRDGDEVTLIDGNYFARVYALCADIEGTQNRNDGYYYRDIEYDDWKWINVEEHEGGFIGVDYVENDGNVALV